MGKNNNKYIQWSKEAEEAVFKLKNIIRASNTYISWFWKTFILLLMLLTLQLVVFHSKETNMVILDHSHFFLAES